VASQEKAAIRVAYELAFAEKVRKTRPDLIVLAGWMLVLSSSTLDALSRDWSDSDEWTLNESEGGLRTPGSSPYASGEPAKGTPIPIINLHPALPGTFPGAHAIKDAWDAFNASPSSSTPDSRQWRLNAVVPGFVTAALGVGAWLSSPVVGAAFALSAVGPTSHLFSKVSTQFSSSTSSTLQRKITKTGIMIHRVIPELDAGEPVIVKEIPMKEGESLEDLEGRIHEIEHVGIVEAVAKVVDMLGDGTWWK
jgi:phosphoribosylglycinamide formyltransferase